MELCIKVVTRPHPEVKVTVVILVIIVAVLAAWQAGYVPAASVSLAASGCLAVVQAARALLKQAAPAGLPAAAGTEGCR